MRVTRADLIACAGVALVAAAVCWPLLARPLGVPPDDDDLDLDLMTYYGYAGAARQTVLEYRQFPLRSPWHGGGYPLYAYPDDLTFTPTMPLVLLLGPWAAIKLDFILTSVVAGVGMFLLSRRKMGYSLPAALFSATAFAIGGFLMARWLRGWRVPTHAAWLPLIMYALWRGRERRRWLALAAVLVAWLIVDHKYVAMTMGWFLLMVGLLRLDGEKPGDAKPAWGYFGRLVGVWVFGAALAGVKLVPMAPRLMEHLRHPEVTRMAAGGVQVACAVALWLVIFAALGVMPFVGRLVRHPKTRRRGVQTAGVTVAVVVMAVALFAPPSRGIRTVRRTPLSRAGWVRHVTDCLVNVGDWREHADGRVTPTAQDRYRHRSTPGPLVCLLALAAVAVRPRRAWRWAILAGLFLAIELGPATPWELGESVRRLPLLSWIRRPREQLNFYLFFLLTLLAGRALDWPKALSHLRTLQGIAWALLAVNVLYVGLDAQRRLVHTVSEDLPRDPSWGHYQVLDDRGILGRPAGRLPPPVNRWHDQPCFRLRENIAVQYWDCDFHDVRRYARRALIPDLIARPYPEPPAGDRLKLAWFEGRGGRVIDWIFTPNEIQVRVRLDTADVLVINQIADDDWLVNPGERIESDGRLMVRLTEPGLHTVRLRYRPRRLYVGLVVSVVAALAGLGLLKRLSRRDAESAGGRVADVGSGSAG